MKAKHPDGTEMIICDLCGEIDEGNPCWKCLRDEEEAEIQAELEKAAMMRDALEECKRGNHLEIQTISLGEEHYERRCRICDEILDED